MCPYVWLNRQDCSTVAAYQRYEQKRVNTCDSNEDGERKTNQEQREDQDKMSFGQGVETHGSQPVIRGNREVRHGLCPSRSYKG